MSVQVSTRSYERAHGKRPRGYGTWAFAVGVEFDKRGFTDLAPDSDPWFVNGTLRDARNEAVARAKSEAKSIGGKLLNVFVEVLS